jgi:hypothetical protein
MKPDESETVYLHNLVDCMVWINMASSTEVVDSCLIMIVIPFGDKGCVFA